MVTEIQFDLFEAPIEVLAHGCNCFNTFGAGLALEIKKRFPEAYQADLETKPGDVSKLGTVKFVSVNSAKIKYIANCYTQFRFGRDQRHLDYEAMYKCLEALRGRTNPKMRIGMPKIGCGLAGGDWKVVRAMIDSAFQKTPIQVYICS